MSPLRSKSILIVVVSLGAFAALVAAAPGAMRSNKINKNLCETTGGGKFVPIPGFPGEKADRRLLTDIKYLRRKYDIFVTDGLSHDRVHAANGEHPIGLALDIVPNVATGGTWKEISRLAKRAEPEQNAPIAPFRWVGYNGDAGHGRGNHLHLSWNHSDTRPGHPAKTVYTLRCPGSGATGGDGGGGKNGGNGKDGGGGGIHPGGGSGGGGGGGGISPRRQMAQFEALASDPVIETGGVDLP
jgi:uncharacterized membrane protein YgcG